MKYAFVFIVGWWGGVLGLFAANRYLGEKAKPALACPANTECTMRNLGTILVGADGTEALTMLWDGKIYIRGELVDDNRVVYEQLREWLATVAMPDLEKRAP